MILSVSPRQRPVFARQGSLFAPARPAAEVFDGAWGAAQKTRAGHRGTLFSAGGTAAQLWNRPPTKRKIDVSGLFSPEDTIIAVARGMHPGIAINMEYRAGIRGGLTALKMAGVKGYTTVNVQKLHSTTLNLPNDDKALIRAAGGGQKVGAGRRRLTLKGAYERIIKIVHLHRLDQAAWGARQLFILQNIKGFQIAHGVAAAAVNVIPGVGQVVSAAAAAHIKISSAIARRVSGDAAKNIEAGIKSYQAWKARRTRATRGAKGEDGVSLLTADGESSESGEGGEGGGDVSAAAAVGGDPPNARRFWLGSALIGVVLLLAVVRTSK
ncbi:MAG: hypothetical protein EXR31_10410 [Betaproteobacteria bacterium]|nr:hypothetical protein [Betaproteobacteria bacterium]